MRTALPTGRIPCRESNQQHAAVVRRTSVHTRRTCRGLQQGGRRDLHSAGNGTSLSAFLYDQLSHTRTCLNTGRAVLTEAQEQRKPERTEKPVTMFPSNGPVICQRR